jgi:hypothetical protein
MTTESLLPETNQALTHAIYEGVGAASACWDNLSGAGVFRDDQARQVAEHLLDRVKILTGFEEPHLGLATNAQLREELSTREKMGNTEDDYRTVGDPGTPQWTLVTEEWTGWGKEFLWQLTDSSSIFSTDQGKTWYDLTEDLDLDGNPRIHTIITNNKENNGA